VAFSKGFRGKERVRPVLRAVAGDELIEVGALERPLLQREVLVGAKVVDSQLRRPRLLLGGLAVEEEHVSP